MAMLAESAKSPGRVSSPERLGGPPITRGGRIHFSLSQRDGTATMELAGELDLAAEQEFEETVRAALTPEVDRLVIDLRALEFIDSTGLRMLLKVDALSRQDGFRLWLVHDASTAPARVLRLTGLDVVLPVVDRPPDLQA